MEQLDTLLKSLQFKLQQLLKQNQLLLKQNAALEKQNIVVKASLVEKDEVITGLKQQADIFKLSNGVLDDTGKGELKKRIDVYLAEIDKCLAIINE